MSGNQSCVECIVVVYIIANVYHHNRVNIAGHFLQQLVDLIVIGSHVTSSQPITKKVKFGLGTTYPIDQ